MKEATFRGVLVPALTPFDYDLRPDSARLTAFCRWLLDQGAAGLAVFGTTSEANSLTLDERMMLLDALLEQDQTQLPAAKLMPGTGACALPDAIRLTRHAVEAGCGGVLCLPPFYYKNVSDDGLYAFYATLIEQIGDPRLRLYLYHIPQMSGVPITLNLIERLLKAYPETLAGIKDSSGNWDNTLAILKNFPDIEIFPSSESRLLEALRLGGAGCISATANVNVAAIAELANCWQDADQDRLNALHRSISAVRGIVEGYPLIPALKAIMAHYADSPSWQTLRPPLTPLAQEQRTALISDLDALGFTLDS